MKIVYLQGKLISKYFCQKSTFINFLQSTSKLTTLLVNYVLRKGILLLSYGRKNHFTKKLYLFRTTHNMALLKRFLPSSWFEATTEATSTEDSPMRPSSANPTSAKVDEVAAINNTSEEAAGGGCQVTNAIEMRHKSSTKVKKKKSFCRFVFFNIHQCCQTW